jgi:hypothetical protein
MTEESGGIGLTQKAIHPNVFRLNPDRLCEIAEVGPNRLMTLGHHTSERVEEVADHPEVGQT